MTEVAHPTGKHDPPGSAIPDRWVILRPESGGDRLTFAGDAVFRIGFDKPHWHNGFDHDPRRRPASGSVP
ncbi:hypothetical protein [Embleya sp. MST-111070]|uniref:hypothetical protein n=1 Tax=Embleya sp. MST-111070 TaxID=3398231 RepID=UPI003F7417A4